MSLKMARGFRAYFTSLIFLFLVSSLTAAAQTAGLSGVVRDASQAVIPKAAVTAVHESTGIKRATTSDIRL